MKTHPYRSILSVLALGLLVLGFSASAQAAKPKLTPPGGFGNIVLTPGPPAPSVSNP